MRTRVITRSALLYWASKYAEGDFGDFLNFVVDLSGCNFDPRQSCSRSALARESNGFYFVFDFCDTLRFLRTLCAMDESQMTSLVYGYADQEVSVASDERMKEIISELHSAPFLRLGAIRAIEDACAQRADEKDATRHSFSCPHSHIKVLSGFRRKIGE